MDAVVGVFSSRDRAEHAVRGLMQLGFTGDRLSLLTPHASEEKIHSVPTTEAEPPGIGRAIGAVTGGAAGAATGIEVAVLAGMIPGVGPVLALGAIGALLFGIGGAAVGATLDRKLREGLPRDELYVYEDALRRGRTVLIALPEDEEQAERARSLLDAAGAEAIDAAREHWWVGLRDAEAVEYTAGGGDFARDEETYRRGFEAGCALTRDGATYTDVIGELRMRCPDVYASESFRQGFARGRTYTRARQERTRAA